MTAHSSFVAGPAVAMPLLTEKDALLLQSLYPTGSPLHPEKVREGGLFQRLVPRGGFASSCFSFAAASMGAGTLGLASAFQSAGIAIGAVQLALVCIATIYSMRLLALCFERTGYHTFESLSRHLFGWFGWWLEKITAFLIAIFCWGATVAYIVAVMGILRSLTSGVSGMPTAFQGDNGIRLLTMLFWAVTMLPLSLVLEISSLRYASVFSTCTSFYLMTTIVMHAATDPASSFDNVVWARWGLSAVEAIPTFVFAFCCQTNLFEIYAEMHPRTVSQATRTSGVAISICTLLYVVSGAAGYVNFGDNVEGDILDNYNAFGAPYLTIAFVAIALTLTVSFPLCIYPTRDAAVQMLGYETAYQTPAKVRILVCFILAAASLALGLYVPNIKYLFDVLGGVCGSAVAFVLPALFFIRSGPFTVADVGLGNFVGVLALLVVGLVTGTLGTVLSVWQCATGSC